MKITARIRKSINNAIRYYGGLTSPYGECGRREKPDGDVTENARLWEPRADLFDLTPVRELREVESDADGIVYLDVYVYGYEQVARPDTHSLDLNIYVSISPEGEVRASARPLEDWPEGP